MTLNQAADYVANAMKQPFNNELIERIKDSIRNKAAKFMYQRASKGESMSYFTLTFSTELEHVNEEDPCDLADDCNWLRTKAPINLELSLPIGAPFHNVRTAKGVPLTYISRSQYMNVRFNKTVQGQLFYVYENGYVWLPNALKLDQITIETIKLDVSTIPYMCSEQCITDNHVFPLPSHLWDYVLSEVKQEMMIEFKIPETREAPITQTDET